MRISVAGGVTKDVAAEIQVRFRVWEREIENATERVADVVMGAAVEQTSGPYTKRDLRRMGHPYARRWSFRPADPGIVNVTEGRIQRGWRREFGARRRSVTIYNIADAARYMTGRGTQRMIPRPVQKGIVQKAYKRVIREYERPFRRLRWRK